MAPRLDLIFAEIDRQLQEVRERVNGLSARSGIVISALALAAALFVDGIEQVTTGEIVAIVLLVSATVVGMVVLVPNITTGPAPTSLARWAGSQPADEAVTSLHDAKLILLESNRNRLAVMTWAFYLQALLATGAVVMACLALVQR